MKVMFNISTPLCVNFALETESSADLLPTQHPANQRTESDPRSELRHPSLFTNITVAPFFFPPGFLLGPSVMPVLLMLKRKISV